MQISGKIAVDANVILSFLIGGKAAKVFTNVKDVEFLTTANKIEEIQEYIPVLAKKKGLDRSTMETAFSLLDVKVITKEVYSSQIPIALDLIGKRDPDDVELLALALTLDCPIWSNDNDLKDLKGVKVYTTAVILRWLEV
ncbi:MAG: PIN domain-containing protein [Bacillota bacterium]